MATIISDMLKQKNNLSFPLVDANDILGGHYSYKTIAERDAIPDARKKQGMAAYVADNGEGKSCVYILEDVLTNTWSLMGGDVSEQISDIDSNIIEINKAITLINSTLTSQLLLINNRVLIDDFEDYKVIVNNLINNTKNEINSKMDEKFLIYDNNITGIDSNIIEINKALTLLNRAILSINNGLLQKANADEVYKKIEIDRFLEPINEDLKSIHQDIITLDTSLIELTNNVYTKIEVDAKDKILQEQIDKIKESITDDIDDVIESLVKIDDQFALVNINITSINEQLLDIYDQVNLKLETKDVENMLDPINDQIADIYDQLAKLPSMVDAYTKAEIDAFNLVFENNIGGIDSNIIEINKALTLINTSITNQLSMINNRPTYDEVYIKEEIDSKLDNINSRLDSNENDILILGGNITGIDSNIIEINKAITGINRNIIAINSGLLEKANVDDVYDKKYIDTLEDRIDSKFELVNTDIKDIQANVTTLFDNVTGIDSNIIEINKALSVVNSTLTTHLLLINDRVTTDEFNDTINKIYGDIENINLVFEENICGIDSNIIEINKAISLINIGLTAITKSLSNKANVDDVYDKKYIDTLEDRIDQSIIESETSILEKVDEKIDVVEENIGGIDSNIIEINKAITLINRNIITINSGLLQKANVDDVYDKKYIDTLEDRIDTRFGVIDEEIQLVQNDVTTLFDNVTGIDSNIIEINKAISIINSSLTNHLLLISNRPAYDEVYIKEEIDIKFEEINKSIDNNTDYVDLLIENDIEHSTTFAHIGDTLTELASMIHNVAKSVSKKAKQSDVDEVYDMLQSAMTNLKTNYMDTEHINDKFNKMEIDNSIHFNEVDTQLDVFDRNITGINSNIIQINSAITKFTDIVLSLNNRVNATNERIDKLEG